MTFNNDPSEHNVEAREDAISSQDSKKHFVKNSLTNIVFFVFNVATSLYFVPYQIHHLGLANYGTVVLANSFVVYIQIMTIAMTSTMGRYVVLNAARNDNDEASSYMSTQLVTTSCLFVVLLPVAAAISYFIPSFVQIPAGQATNARILFFFVFLAFLLSLYHGVWGITLYVSQRFDIRNYLVIGQQVVRYSTWIVLFTVLTPCVWQVGLGMVFEATFLIVALLIIIRRLTPMLKPRLRFDRIKFYEMLKLGSWITIDQLGTILFLGVDALVINKTLGPSSTGKYGAILGMSMMIRGLGGLMSEMVVPITIASYARQDWTGLLRISTRTVKFVSLGMAIPLGITCGLATPFVCWWLGPQYRSLNMLVWLLLAPQVLNAGVQPLSYVAGAAGKVAIPGIATVICGLLKLALAIALVEYTGLGIYGVALAGLIAFVLKSAIFTPYYTGRVFNLSSWPLHKSLFPSMGIFAVASLLALCLANAIYLATFFRLLLAGGLLCGALAIITYFGALDSEDRDFLQRVILKRSTA